MNGELRGPPGYEVLRRIGRGGMGEVFHAVRLAAGGFRKDVALKRLSVDQAVDGKAVQRFLQEARVSAQLEHRHLVRVYDLLEDAGVHYMVMELLRGRTLLELARWLRESGKPVPWAPFLDAAAQALDGLAWAHALSDDSGRPLGLVHRDLTPRNVFVCEDGVVKVLDFGIVKLHHAASAYTTAGNIAGTFEFLSPEAARAGPLDARSDLYQLGASLYFCLTGKSPHGEGSPLELLNHALHHAPQPLVKLRTDLPAAVNAVVMKALAAEPGERFPDARAMQAAITAVVSEAAPDAPSLKTLVRSCLDDSVEAAAPRPSAPTQDLHDTRPARGQGAGSASRAEEPTASADVALPATQLSRRRTLGGAVAVLAAGGVGALAGKLLSARPTPLPSWHRRTFRRGTVHHARFTPDGRGLVVSATWGDEAPNLWLSSPDNPEARALDVPGQELLAVSSTGALLLLDDAQPLYGFARRGTLNRAALAGGAPRPELEFVQSADFGPDGALLVLRWAEDSARLEFPSGTLLAESATGWFSEPRVSPSGDRVAVLEHPGRFDDRGRVVVLDRAGKRLFESEEFLTIRGVAWGSGDEVWVTAGKDDNTRALWALQPGGAARVLARAPASLTLLDSDGKGRALVTRDDVQITVSAARDGVVQRELSWFDASFAMGLSDDGKTALINEGGGDAVGAEYGAYLRPMDGGPAVRLANGHAAALSPDGKWALVISSTWDRVHLVPVGAGTSREVLLRPGIHAAAFSHDQKWALVAFSASGRQALAKVPLEGGEPVTVDVPGHEWRPPSCPLSPDGRAVILTELSSGELRLVEEGSAPRPLSAARPGDSVLRFSPDGTQLFVTRPDELPAPIFRLTLATGQRELLYSLTPVDTTGVAHVSAMALSADGRAAAFTWWRNLSVLFLVDGLRPE